MTTKVKTCNDSRLVYSVGLLSRDLNNASMLYGGKLMDILDSLSGTVAINHSESICVTASVDSVDFIRGIKQGDILYAESYVSGVGKRSLEVFTKFIGRTIRGGEEYLASVAFTTFTAMEDVVISQIQPESEEEKFICSGYEERRKTNLNRREKTKALKDKLEIEMIWKCEL